MDNDLNRSVRFLEDALTPSGRGLFKKSFSRQNEGDSQSKLDLSVTMAPHEYKRLARLKKLSFYDETMTEMLHGDRTLAGSVIQANISPWKLTVDSLYAEYFEILQSHAGGENILDVVSDLARCCSDALKVIQGLKSNIELAQTEEEVWLENEKNTWRLLFILYEDRLLADNEKDLDNKDVDQYSGQSEKLCAQNLFKRDGLFRESQLIIDWLEWNAAEKDDEMLHFADSTVGWENTLHQLQSANTIAFASSRQTVSNMDPDAPYYQKKPLHDLDAEDDKRLSRKIFTEIRSGKLEEAQKLCRKSGHSWKAAIFEGWRLFHDPNLKEMESEKDNDVDDGYEEMEKNKLKDIEGSESRDIWKNVAISFCKQDYLNAYDKASVGSFCGYNSAILKVCRTWDDYLWAYMKTMVDIRVESEIRDCVTRPREYQPLPEEYWTQRMSLNEIFQTLETSENQSVKDQSSKPELIIQKHIILDQISNLLTDFKEWIEDPNITTHFLRFMAHLVLFFNEIGQGHNREIIEKVLEAYIKKLMELNKTQLVAFYAGKLNETSGIYLYAKHLEKIIDVEERKESLRFAEECGLDVLAVTKQVMENVRNMPEEFESNGNLQYKITETDKYKISALDWVFFYESQSSEALQQANALIFTFLIMGKLDAAQLAFIKIPVDIVDKILNKGDQKITENGSVKEYLAYRAYFNANESFNEWFKQCKTKPVAPLDLPENAKFPEKVAHQHRVSQFKAELERWKLTVTHLSKNATTQLYNVLLFPEGWLSGAKNGDYLRSTCIPEVVLLLYSVLSESDDHEACVQLADIIASEKHRIYKVYSREKLAELLTKLCESSVALLNAKKDPWGNETSA